MSYRLAIAPLIFSIVAAGCAESPVPASAVAKQVSKAVPAPSNEPVAASAEAFMRAILSGDKAAAAELLTARAAARYAADSSVLASMGMTVQEFNVGEIRLLDEDEAAVQCHVTEAGASEPEELCCLLKRESPGWRVCGLACESGDGGSTVISFEGAAAPMQQPAPQFVEGRSAPPASTRTAADPGAAPLR